MKNYFFNGTIDNESTQKLIEFLNNNENVKIFLTSGGGENYCTEVILNIINSRNDIEIEAVGRIHSNAFYLFFSALCKKSLNEQIFGMYHYSGCNYKIAENGKLEYMDDRQDLKALRSQLKITEKWCIDLGFNENEMRKLRANKDVFFQKERLKELLQFQQKNETI